MLRVSDRRADTTATAPQWIMANLVKQPEIQQKLWTEIEEAVGKDIEAKSVN